MNNKQYLVLLVLVAIIAIIPLAMYNGMSEDDGFLAEQMTQPVKQ